jgi:hypothetical protein
MSNRTGLRDLPSLVNTYALVRVGTAVSAAPGALAVGDGTWTCEEQSQKGRF